MLETLTLKTEPQALTFRSCCEARF